MQLKMGSKFYLKLNINQIKVFKRIAKKEEEPTTATTRMGQYQNIRDYYSKFDHIEQ